MIDGSQLGLHAHSRRASIPPSRAATGSCRSSAPTTRSTSTATPVRCASPCARVGADGEVVGEERFFGLFSAAAYRASVTHHPPDPRARRVGPAAQPLDPSSHTGRALRNVLETFPATSSSRSAATSWPRWRWSSSGSRSDRSSASSSCDLAGERLADPRRLPAPLAGHAGDAATRRPPDRRRPPERVADGVRHVRQHQPAGAHHRRDPRARAGRPRTSSTVFTHRRRPAHAALGRPRPRAR